MGYHVVKHYPGGHEVDADAVEHFYGAQAIAAATALAKAFRRSKEPVRPNMILVRVRAEGSAMNYLYHEVEV